MIRQLGSVTYTDEVTQQCSPPEEVIIMAADGVTRSPYGRLYKPAGYDSTKKYPLLVHIYGGPTVQNVQRTRMRWTTTIRLKHKMAT